MIHDGHELAVRRLLSLLFLMREETPIPSKMAFYDFFPHKAGPFSHTVLRDINVLGEMRLVKRRSTMLSPSRMVRTMSLSDSLPSRIAGHIKRVALHYHRFSDRRLSKYISGQYPQFMLRNGRGQQNTRTTRRRDRRVVHTIGYEGLSIDNFLKELMQSQVEAVVDVRSRPQSRKYGFSKGNLSRWCEELGVRYIGFPELGVPSDLRRYLRCGEDLRQLWACYRLEVLNRQTDAIVKVMEIITESRAALLCFEANPELCHRNILAKRLARKTGSEIDHIWIHSKH
jgi:hypothetical protein